MNHLTGCNDSSGYIAIQSEGGDIEVRKLSLTPLPYLIPVTPPVE
jgi:hypothetical protein